MSKILVIEDSEEYQLTIRASLENDHELVFCGDAERILDRTEKTKPDLILLDIGLPKIDGRKACQVLQKSSRTSHIPILFVTALQSADDIAMGLSLGAEDYITKPFNPVELRARCAARLRKAQASLDKEIWVRVDPVTLNLLTRKAFCIHGEAAVEVGLTPAEFQLLLYFCRNPDRNISRSEIEQQLASENRKAVNTRVIDAQVKALRKKSTVLAHCIVSIYGVGYRFVAKS